MFRFLVTIAAAFVPSITFSLTLAEEPQFSFSRSIQKIEAGVKAKQEGAHRWNRVVMLAKPRIASGDTDAVTEFIQQTVSKFVLTILASVEESTLSSEDQRYRLAEVGIGHSVRLGEEWIVITPDNYESSGVRLSFLERQVLAENQRQFAEIRTVVRTSTLLIFDAPSLILYDGRHQEFVMRHLVWIDSKSGRHWTLIWLLRPSGLEKSEAKLLQTLATEPICLWDHTDVEDRAIHVDGREFTLGIPGKRAFALEKLPAGKSIGWNETTRELAALSAYNEDSLRSLLTAINQAMQQKPEFP